MRIAIAGATGFIGCQVVQHLLQTTEHEIVALSRSGGESENPRLSFVQADLYSLLEVERAIADCDLAIYLVHSMSPSSRLIQGDFQDFDFLLADNFARASKKKKIKRIIYVSGIIPDQKELSVHLASRLEVEKVLSGYGVPTTTFRCGIVLGPAGSSFEILEKLVDRLPIMVLPKWMLNETQAIYIGDLVKFIEWEIQQALEPETRVYDAGHPKVLTYKALVQEVIRHKGKKTPLIDLPQVPVGLSKLWIRLVTGVPKDLAYPLIDSLVHSMVGAPERALPEKWQQEMTAIPEAIERSLTEKPCRLERKNVTKRSVKKESEVQSVQRLHLPERKSAEWVAAAYIHWLPRYLKNLIRVRRDGLDAYFYFLFIKKPLLVLSHSEERSAEDRQLFYVSEGLLVKKKSKGRLELRESPDQKNVIAGIHRFRPRLPWLIYRFTQAYIHAWVMNRFDHYLTRESFPAVDAKVKALAKKHKKPQAPHEKPNPQSL